MSETITLADWVAQETNRALRSVGQVAEAVSRTTTWGLPQHGDRPKAWDNLLAVWWASQLCEPDAVILDAGAGNESAFLPGLQRLGFTELTAVNLDERGWRQDAAVRFVPGDITDMHWFGSGEVDFIACLSVIEHGVDVSTFLAEAARVLKPGGHLFVSTDYWEEPIDCGDRVAFGAPVRVFSGADIRKLIDVARVFGLVPTTDVVDLRCQDRVVEWIGLAYTFINLLFRKDVVLLAEAA